MATINKKLMACQICKAKSGFYPLCTKCFKLKDEGKISKCDDCGKWKEGSKPRCMECWKESQHIENIKSKDFKPSKIEEENNNYRFKYPATFRTDDGHLVRSKAELLIDNCLFRHKIAHAYEKKVLGVDEEIFCDFFVDYEKPVYIEFWGGIDDKYLARKEVKKKIYATKTNTALIELTEKDIVILEETLLKKLRPFLPKNFEFD
ncbi:MAG TPA: hypothetical protein DEP85_00620 [Holosporales bacterium]|nr:hypothetical protein [Holosporales bacterium]